MNGTTLKLRRKSLGLTQEELGNALGITATTVLRHENSEAEIPVMMEAAVSKLMDTHIEKLQQVQNDVKRA